METRTPGESYAPAVRLYYAAEKLGITSSEVVAALTALRFPLSRELSDCAPDAWLSREMYTALQVECRSATTSSGTRAAQSKRSSSPTPPAETEGRAPSSLPATNDESSSPVGGTTLRDLAEELGVPAREVLDLVERGGGALDKVHFLDRLDAPFPEHFVHLALEAAGDDPYVDGITTPVADEPRHTTLAKAAQELDLTREFIVAQLDQWGFDLDRDVGACHPQAWLSREIYNALREAYLDDLDAPEFDASEPDPDWDEPVNPRGPLPLADLARELGAPPEALVRALRDQGDNVPDASPWVDGAQRKALTLQFAPELARLKGYRPAPTLPTPPGPSSEPSKRTVRASHRPLVSRGNGAPGEQPPPAPVPSPALFVRLTTTGARQALDLLAPDAGPSPDDRTTRVRAASALQSAIGREPTAYLSLIADVDRDTGWNKLALRLPGDDGRAVDLLLARKPRCLLVIGARRTSASKYVHELELTPRIHVGVDSATPIPTGLLKRLDDLPTREEREAEVDARLERWVRYLEVEQRHAEAERFAVPYTALHRHDNPGRIRVELDPRAPRDLLARAAQCRRGDRLHLTRLDEGPDDDGRGGRRLASVEVRSYDAKSRRLTLDLEDDDADSFRAGRLRLPEEGLVVNDAAGSLAMIRRQQSGIKRLKLHGGAHPDLDRILFGGNRDLPLPPFGPVEPVPLDECLDPTRINERQRLAVALALHTPDCLFLQGPPGTGKTTVIAELCYQLARRGQRVLVASQANLAVDNALSRLQHSRDLLAVRLGPSDKVEEDAQEFVGDRAVQRWLRSVKDHSRDRVDTLRRQLDARAWFDAHGEALVAWARDAESVETERQALLATAQARRRDADLADVQAARHAETADGARRLADALSGEGVPSPAVAALWSHATISGARKTWSDAVDGVRAELGATARTPWDLSEALEEQRRSSRADPGFDAAVTEAQQFVDDHSADLHHLREANEARANAARGHSRASQAAAQAHTDAEAAEREHARRKKHVEAVAFAYTAGAPVLSGAWPDDSRISPTASAITARLQKAGRILTIPSGDERTPHLRHPDLPSLITAWGRFERDGRSADAERALAAIEAAMAELSERAAHPLWRFFTRTTFDRHLDDFRQERAALVRDLGTQTQRLGVCQVVHREREDYLNRLRADVADHAARASHLRHTADERRADAERRQAELKATTATADQWSAYLRSLLRRLRDELGAATGTMRDLTELLEETPDVEKAFKLAASTLREAHAARERRRSRLDQYAQTLDAARNRAARDVAELARHAESSANVVASQSSEARALAERSEREAGDIERSLSASGELWDVACDLAGTDLDRSAATPDAVRALCQTAAGLASDPARLDHEVRLLKDWIERLEDGGAVGRELTKEFHRRANVVGVTCAHAGKKAFYEGSADFDVVVVDEVSKATPTELLLPALLGKRVVLVGDHRQLPPIFGQEGSFEEAAAELGIATGTLKDALQSSLFKERYEHLAAIAPVGGDAAAADAPRAVMLTTQYRMHSHIMVGVNQFYDDQLQLGHIDADGRSVPLDEHRAHGLTCPPWLSPDDHLVWIDTPTGGDWAHTQDGTTRFNNREVDVVARVLHALTSTAGGALDIGVTSVYASQVRKLRAAADKADLSVETRDRLRVSTVDKFQGMERDVMVVSLVLNGQGHRPGGFLRTPERVNVAMSRARRLLVIVGSSYNYCELTGAESPYARFYDAARTQGRIVDASLVLSA